VLFHFFVHVVFFDIYHVALSQLPPRPCSGALPYSWKLLVVSPPCVPPLKGLPLAGPDTNLVAPFLSYEFPMFDNPFVVFEERLRSEDLLSPLHHLTFFRLDTRHTSLLEGATFNFFPLTFQHRHSPSLLLPALEDF